MITGAEPLLRQMLLWTLCYAGLSAITLVTPTLIRRYLRMRREHASVKTGG